MDTTDHHTDSLSKPLISLMKGVVFREKDERLWQQLENQQIPVQDYVKVLGLELVLDPAEGYAWLKTCEPDEGEDPLPRLVGRRQLSYPVSLIIALLRKKLAESDSSGSDTRLILSIEDIADMVKVFFPSHGNEALLLDRIQTHLNKIADLGFIRRLKGQTNKIEVVRILKAFVDAQWLREFDDRLREYHEKMVTDSDNPEEDS